LIHEIDISCGAFVRLGCPDFINSSTGASNLRPTGRMRPSNIFLRPKLDSEFNEKSVIWPFFLRFLTDCGPKYGKKVDLRPRYQLVLDAPVLVLARNRKIVRVLGSQKITKLPFFHNFSSIFYHLNFPLHLLTGLLPPT
jgi:hypothetical protein